MFWYKVTKAAKWRNRGDARSTFGHAGIVRVGSGRTAVVLNIGGNKSRLIAAIHFDRETVYVLRVLTHKEYTRGKWKEEL